jgi:transposase
MIYIGIDVAKDSLVGVRIDRSSCVKETFVIENTSSSIERFIGQISKKWKRITVGCEATGYYHNALALACLDKRNTFSAS